MILEKTSFLVKEPVFASDLQDQKTIPRFCLGIASVIL
jgi:hypothetical protein